MKRKILIAVAAVLVIIQFFQPKKNISIQPSGKEITKQFNVPDEVQSVLKTACYDCHSNNTRYPWYSRIQPGGWLLARHIKEGKEELNFDEFLSYSPAKQYDKFEDMDKLVSKKEMPLKSYTLIHRDAVLSEEQTGLLVNWTKSARTEMESKYDAGSLKSADTEEHKE